MMQLIAPALIGVMACHGGLPEPSSDSPYIRGTFRNLLGAGLEDVQVCVEESSEACTVTDSHGDFIVAGLPQAADVSVRVQREGFYPTLLLHHSTDSEPAWDKKLLTDGMMQTIANRTDEALQPGRGHFSFMVHQAHFSQGQVQQTAGISISIEPETDQPAYYLNSLQLPDRDLDATVGSGGGGLLNLEPGDYQVTFHGANGPCSRIISWDFQPGSPVPVRIEADRGTYIDVLCPES